MLVHSHCCLLLYVNYLYSINKNLGRDFDVYVDTTYYELPLNKLPKGKHVLVAVQSPKRIVFVVKILKDNPDSESVKVVSEESIIREPVQVTSTERG